MAYATKEDPYNRGEVISTEITTLAIDVNVTNPPRVGTDVTEVILRVNGRPVSRMHPEKARRMGIIE